MNAHASFADRGRQALAGPTTSAELEDLLHEGQKVVASANAAADQARQRALDPLIEDDAAKRERETLVDAELERDRARILLSALADRQRQVEAEERNAARRREYDAAKAERDALAADLKARWPALSAEMVELLRRIVASDARLVGVNASLPAGADRLDAAEAVARGLASNFLLPTTPAQPATRLASAMIPRFAPGGASDGLLWAPSMAGASWRAL
jgi:hypothetical protein